ncbi:MAG TPA: DUF3108 domain-containing protein [Gemmatimonadales bacterium]|nr:DUF3108 domain-containing protein [Gemmatimonadales bacterium]
MSLAPVLAAFQFAAATVAPPASAYPFGVGERFDYSAKLGVLSVGTASIQVASIDTVRGQPAFVFRFALDASALMFKIQSSLESWTSVQGFRSLRFRQDSKENSRRYLREYEIFGDSGYYRQTQASATTPTSAEPLDDASFLYFVRTTPLEVGKSYRFERHFKPELNPILIRVLKREMIELPDGSKVQCLVLNPVVGDKMFSERADARLWITDDARRIPVQIRTTQYGTITLRLQKITPAPGT